jgi:hypothetical protein
MCTYVPKKSFSSLAHKNYFGQKRFLCPGRKVFFYPTVAKKKIPIKKLRNVPFYTRKKNYSPKIENRKNKNRGFFW